jgi:hypothetical protein
MALLGRRRKLALQRAVRLAALVELLVRRLRGERVLKVEWGSMG